MIGDNRLPRKRRISTPLMRPQGHPFLALSHELDRMLNGVFDDFLTPAAKEGSLGGFHPSFNFEELEEAFVVKAELPGVKEEDLEVFFEDNQLTISGEKKEDFEGTAENASYVGRSYGSFRRVIPFNVEISEEGVSALLKDGLLTINLPKAVPTEKKTRKISVKSSL